MSKSAEAFRTISEVADLLETPTHVLRFWESRFPQIKPVKRAGGRRYYRPDDVMLLGGIKKLLHEQGLAIRGVQKILKDDGVKAVMALSGLDLGSEDEGGDVAQSLASLIEAPAPADVVLVAPEPAQAPDAEEPWEEAEAPAAEIAPPPAATPAEAVALPPLDAAPAPEPAALFPLDPEDPAPAAPRGARIIRPAPVRRGGWQQGSLFDDPADEAPEELLESDSSPEPEEPAASPANEAPEAPFAFDVPEEPAPPPAPAQVVSLMIPTREAPAPEASPPEAQASEPPTPAAPAAEEAAPDAAPARPSPLIELATRLATLAPGGLSAQERTRLLVARERLRGLAARLGQPPKSA